MNNSKIDEAILSYLSSANGHWSKVAAVIARASEAMKGDLPEGEPDYNLVARRIKALVSEGRLNAQGDIKKWRHSEVRIPN
jgi:hypothetical protein